MVPNCTPNQLFETMKKPAVSVSVKCTILSSTFAAAIFQSTKINLREIQQEVDIALEYSIKIISMNETSTRKVNTIIEHEIFF